MLPAFTLITSRDRGRGKTDLINGLRVQDLFEILLAGIFSSYQLLVTPRSAPLLLSLYRLLMNGFPWKDVSVFCFCFEAVNYGLRYFRYQKSALFLLPARRNWVTWFEETRAGDDVVGHAVMGIAQVIWTKLKQDRKASRTEAEAARWGTEFFLRWCGRKETVLLCVCFSVLARGS